MPGDGPVPKRSKERRRRNKAVVSEGRTRSAVAWPEPDGDWHVVARDWFLSLKGSGQSQFYEPSDVAAARFVAEAMSRRRGGPAGCSAAVRRRDAGEGDGSSAEGWPAIENLRRDVGYALRQMRKSRGPPRWYR